MTWVSSDVIIRSLISDDLLQLKVLYDDLCDDNATKIDTMKGVY